ncbi:hypothetical protein UA08_00509 [Talaromyces atroroseus]|uniref:Uncharacterized protein n=1 Tax=Talaromyces atroroseus TaxID=1441469 RepID=A0A225ARJ5_TALAT|nr:hypothetical protein UA08_00509 [Talaromyces atroroseus]OKL63610.1 hypothetical protein UA08_00509 [Talaromyces atroroseus]
MSPNVNSHSSFEVVVPYRRMKGWAIVPWTEGPEPGTPEQNILPHGQKRIRSQTKRFGSETEVGPTAKRKATPPLEDKREQIRPAKIRVGVRIRSKEYNQLEREVQRLKMQNALLAVAESQEIQSLKAEVKRLESHKVEQNKKIDWLISKSLDPASSSSDTNLDEPEMIKMKDKEIEQQNITIRDLHSSLRSALNLDMLLSTSQDQELLTANVNFASEMEDIELRVLRAAEYISNCLYPLDKLTLSIQIHPDLGDMILKVTGSMKTLTSMPATSEFAEKFHRATLLHMLKHDLEFKTCFLDSHVEELQAHITALLDPLLNPSELEKQEVNFHRELRDLLSSAFSFRSRCFPVGGTRYEVIQFQPGERFDPTMMEAQDATGNLVPIPKDKKNCTIKLCVHGLIVAHTDPIQESSSGLQKVKQLSQPFQASKRQGVRGATAGEVISGKAIVIL